MEALRQIQVPVQESAPAVSVTALGARRCRHATDDSRRSAHNEPNAPQAFGPDDLLTRTEGNV